MHPRPPPVNHTPVSSSSSFTAQFRAHEVKIDGVSTSPGAEHPLHDTSRGSDRMGFIHMLAAPMHQQLCRTTPLDDDVDSTSSNVLRIALFSHGWPKDLEISADGGTRLMNDVSAHIIQLFCLQITNALCTVPCSASILACI